MKLTQEQVQEKRMATMKRLDRSKHAPKVDVRRVRRGTYVAIKWMRITLGDRMPPTLPIMRSALHITQRRFKRDFGL